MYEAKYEFTLVAPTLTQYHTACLNCPCSSINSHFNSEKPEALTILHLFIYLCHLSVCII